VRYDQEWLMFEAGRLLQADSTLKLPPKMDRQLRDLALEQGPLLYILAACEGLRRSLTAQLASKHMVTDEAIRTAIGIQGQLSGVDLVVQAVVEMLQPPVASTGEAEPTFDFLARMAGVSPEETFHADVR
jgi:hypothetical protein